MSDTTEDKADLVASTERKVTQATLELCAEFLDAVPTLTDSELHAKTASLGVSNPAQVVRDWRISGKVFGVTHGGRDLFPAFQFGEDGQPLPVINEILAILNRDPHRTDWDNALWFVGDTGWLDGRRPLDCILSERPGVLRAAEQEVLRDAE
jgi:hypothetical protein